MVAPDAFDVEGPHPVYHLDVHVALSDEIANVNDLVFVHIEPDSSEKVSAQSAISADGSWLSTHCNGWNEPCMSPMKMTRRPSEMSTSEEATVRILMY